MKFSSITGKSNLVWMPSPECFKMPGTHHFKGSIEYKIMWDRYRRLLNKPRYPEEIRLIGSEYCSPDRF